MWGQRVVRKLGGCAACRGAARCVESKHKCERWGALLAKVLQYVSVQWRGRASLYIHPFTPCSLVPFIPFVALPFVALPFEPILTTPKSSIPARIHRTAGGGGGFYTCADTKHKKNGYHSASCAKRVPTDVRLHSPPRIRVLLHAAEYSAVVYL